MADLFEVVIQTLNSLLAVVMVAAQLMGVGLVIYALVGFTKLSSGLNTRENSSSVYLKSLVVGSFLIVVTTVIDVTSMTVFDIESRKILDYTLLPNGQLNEQSRYLLATVYAVIATVGFFGFIKGWLILRSSAPQHTMGRGLMFIVAGTLAINLDSVMHLTAGSVAQFSNELAELIRLFTPM